MKAAVKSGEISIQDLYDMTSNQRRETFGRYASGELAQEINSKFEAAMISKQKTALKKWAESVFTAREKQKQNYTNVINRINELEKMGVLNNQNSDSFLSDLVADKLGVRLTGDEVQTITEKAKNLETLFNEKTDDGLPSVEYFVQRESMEKYLNSLAPTARLRVATSVAGRGAMLLSFKSPLTNIIGNSVNGFVQGLERRISSTTYKGLNGSFAVAYVKKVNKIYQKSGYDISRMESISDHQKRLGEEITHSEGKGAVRQIGRWYEDIVFKQLMGAPDVAASSVAFADSANLASSKIARSEKLGSAAETKARALEIFKDATKIKPETIEGEVVRSQAIADAQYSTYTNKSGYSDFAMAIRYTLNKASGNIRLGDQLMPFVKTPANVVQAGVDAAGLGAFKGFYKLPEAIRQIKAGNGDPMKEVVRLFVRSGLGFTLSLVLAFAFDPDDFIGDYNVLSQKERDLAKLKNAPYNSIKIGNKYVSLDYFGPLGAAFVGIMYARKYGDSLPESIYQYGKGVGSQSLRLPGLREFVDLYSSISKEIQKGSLGDVADGITDEMVAYIRARTIPAIVNDFAQATDSSVRQTGSSQLSKTQATIPGVRKGLPEAINQATGEAVKTEGFFPTLLFGARLKTASQNKVVAEINRLSGTSNGPTVADITYSSDRVKQLKVQIGEDKFQDALKYYGREYGLAAQKKINSGSYKGKSDEDKKKILDTVRSDTMEKMLKKYHYKKPKK